MVAIDRLKNAINNSSELSVRGENRKALTLLDDEIANAVGENKSIWVCTLSRHASTIADQMGDLGLVRQYREQCLAHDPDNPLTLLSVAEVLDRQGEKASSKSYAIRAYQLAAQRGTELDRSASVGHRPMGTQNPFGIPKGLLPRLHKLTESAVVKLPVLSLPKRLGFGRRALLRLGGGMRK